MLPDSNDMPYIYPICEFPRPVRQLHVVGNRWITVGFDHVVSIWPYKEYGCGSYITWFKISYDNGVEIRVNSMYIDEVEFEKEEHGEDDK